MSKLDVPVDTHIEQYPERDTSLDPLILAELHSEDSRLLQTLVDLFISATPGKIEEMGVALSSGDLSSMAFIAHNLQGVAGNLGARRMERLCSEIEHGCRAGRLACVTESFDPLRAEYVRVIGLLQDYRQSLLERC
jgi:HPt (histidine-containing phosphotransfer) domain-containing protein